MKTQQLIQLRPLFSYCTAEVPSRLHTLDTSPLRELNQTQDRSGHYAEKKSLSFVPGTRPRSSGHLARSLVT
jgi:hypothetical protein